jgi:hypothetical protein
MMTNQQDLQSEVKVIHGKILAETRQNEALRETYKGCQIYYNKLYPKQDIMLLGINPGSGYWKAYDHKLVEKFEPFTDEKFDLAAEVKSVFQKLGKPELWERSFRTNCYFFATDSGKELNRFIKLLSKDLRAEIDAKSRQWIKTMVTRVSPKIIICEGFAAYRRLLRIFHPNREIIEDGEYTKIAKVDDKLVLAFKRTYCYFYSGKSKEEFIQKLRPNVDKLIG